MSTSHPLSFSTWLPGGSDTAAPVLEGRLRRPAGAAAGAAGAAVLLHPHPAHGGCMDVWLLAAIGERLADAGWTVLRFNLRGVGGSTGRVHDALADEAAGAVADARGAVDEVLRHAPGWQRCALVGWSFGALLGLLLGVEDTRVTDWVGIAPPTRPLPDLPMPLPPEDVRRWGARRTVIVGQHDQFFPPDTTAVVAPDAVHVMAGADHFLFDRDDDVANLVVAALGRP